MDSPKLISADSCKHTLGQQNLPIPTIKPYPHFDAKKDAKQMRAAVKGLGTDEDVIIRILESRTVAQRQQIQIAYRNSFDRDLIKDLKGDLSGYFGRLVIFLFYSWPEHISRILKNAMKNLWGPDQRIIVDLLATATNSEIKEIKAAYLQLYGKDLKIALEKKIKGNMQSILKEILEVNRQDNEIINSRQAELDAKKLRFQTGPVSPDGAKQFPQLDTNAVINLFTTLGFSQLIEMQRAYEDNTSLKLETVLEDEYSGDFLYALKTILAVARNKAGFFAERLHATVAGLGTDDKTLISLIVLRSEIDLGSIKEEYEKIYKTPLAKDVANDLQEFYNINYKKLMLGIIHH